jgi:hypothetical protein
MNAKLKHVKENLNSRQRNLAYGRELRQLIEDHRAVAKRLVELLEYLEDEEDHRAIEEAKRRNGNKPLIPWEEAKKKLGLKF